MLDQILPIPDDISTSPDRDTRRGLADLANDAQVEGRVLHIRTRFVSWGTNDKAHAASVVLSILLLSVLLVCGIIGFWARNEGSFEKLILALSSSFTFTVGVAIGKGGQKSGD